ncbi:NAD(P)/FAD-dependent oxidoreductase [Lactococcus protaetiae]|uniref:FAD-binding oxidoreductase n=1 Tax=Lactococcus protaetiae TaxID=2592653 RepID=A0A514ZB82_9LACT|nr:FAD-dependent oxidoreductase [Lactococcus protaetiae]QDK71854.1 FAD-binding oxidoreductase [Lactococcus protaetiae]
MKKIAIIGGGIIGMTLANYIDTTQYEVILFDSQKNQATQASAGIISPWLSKRRNKKWYQLAKDGAAFFEQLVRDFDLPAEVYEQCGTLFLREPDELERLKQLALERKKEAPEIGEIQLLSPEETVDFFPLLKELPSLYISGGARLDGKSYLEHLKRRAMARGVKFVTEEASLHRVGEYWGIESTSENIEVKELILCAGPALKNLLSSIDYETDVRPQKGQLLSFETTFDTGNWPVAFLDGEADLIPFQKGKILLGATHENEAGWDLKPTQAAFEQLTQGVERFVRDSSFTRGKAQYRVGTRAYTSDFAPFFGPIMNEKGLIVACGLGSSGLTVGPYIAYLLAQYLNHPEEVWEVSKYQKEMTNYVIKKNDNQ